MEKFRHQMSSEQTQIVETLSQAIKEEFYGEGTGHDWYHIARVLKMSRIIAEQEGKLADFFLISVTALVHEVGDWKFHEEGAAKKMIREILSPYNIEEKIITTVLDIVNRISFKGESVPDNMSSYEGQIVQDADRLDALGAIGIARTFAYGGHKGVPLYEPAIPPVSNMTAKKYKRGGASTINHFYEKLFLLKDRMHTETARRIAKDRHQFMEKFLERFLKEWEGSL